MRRTIEGLVISKTPFREQDLICRLLLRNGKKIGVLFFGGRNLRGKSASAQVELGFLLKIVLQQQRAMEGEHLYLAKEWQTAWFPKNIRLNFEAFNLSCLFFEVLDKVSHSDNLHEEEREGLGQEFSGIFRVGSNSIYYLEDSLVKNNFSSSSHLFLFCSKLIYELGVGPRLGHCAFCENPLSPSQSPLFFIFHLGGFSCPSCTQTQEEDDQEMFKRLMVIQRTRYADFESFPPCAQEINRKLFNYFCYQFQLETHKFKTIKYFQLLSRP